MLKKITVSAPGKLMLLGEHAVVYNHPCLVTAVDQRMNETVEFINEPVLEIQASDIQITGYKKPLSEIGRGDIPKEARFVEAAVANLISHPELISGSNMFLKQVQNDKVGIRITTKSEFSSQFGLGSSSSSTVCTIKAVSEMLGLHLSQKEIFDLSYKTILDIQGKASGFDVAAAVYGGTQYFVTGGKVIEPLKIDSLPLVVGYSAIKADTVSLIKKVKESFANRQNRLEEIYVSIEMLVKESKNALIKTDWETFGKIMNKNQEYLRELGVSIEKLDNMITAALDAGAYGAKLSGAGGGDCMIAVVSDDKRKKVKEAIQRVGGEVIDIKTGAEGVAIEQSNNGTMNNL